MDTTHVHVFRLGVEGDVFLAKLVQLANNVLRIISVIYHHLERAQHSLAVILENLLVVVILRTNGTKRRKGVLHIWIFVK